MMGGEAFDADGDSTPAAKRLPRVCLRRKQGAGALRVTLGQGSVDIQGYALESSGPAATTTSPAKATPANFSVTRVLPGRHDSALAAASAASGPSEGRFRLSPATPPAAAAAGPASAAAARGTAVRDSGLSNVFDAFEREFERFQQEVQHSYLSDGCIDPWVSTSVAANRSVAAVAESPGGPCLPEAAAARPPPAQCGRCGCNYTSHHECVRLVATGCAARCTPSSPSTSTSGTGSGSCSGAGGGSGGASSRTAAAQPSPEQRVLRQASAELHERDDADSGYGGSGGSLPKPQSSGAAARRGSDPAKAANGSGSEAFADKSSTLPALARDDLCKMIRSYNLRCGSSQLLTMPDGDDATFSGAIRVCINLSRPISMLLTPRPPSIYEALNRPASEHGGDHPVAKSPLQQRITTAKFSVPRDVMISLHVSSDHVASDVVKMLLGKFKITDNPRKFALYEQTLVNSIETKLRKVADGERPLMIFLLWNSSSAGSCRGAAQETQRFVLKEDNSKGSDVNWDAFSVPELLNFLRILEREEKDYVEEIRQKYVARRKHLETALRDAARGGSSSGVARSKSRP